MTATEFAVRVVVIGLVAFDPLGAIVGLAGITAGARRRGLTALLGGYVAVMTALGVVGTLLARTLGHTAWAATAGRYVRVHHLVAYGEAVVGLALLLWGAVSLVKRLRKGREVANGGRSGTSRSPDGSGKSRSPDGLGTGAEPSSTDGPRWLARFSAHLATARGLAVAGGIVAVSMVVDPGFTALAVVAREQPIWQWVPAWVVWCVISQSLLAVLWLAAIADRHGTGLERVGRVVRTAVGKSGAAIALLLVIVGALMLLDAGLSLRP